MSCEHKTKLLATYLVIIAFMLSGCETTSATLKFNQSEVKLIPAEAIEKALSPRYTNETVKLRAKSLYGPAEVKGFEGQKYVIVTNEQNGKEMKIAISEITEIKHIRKTKSSAASDGKHQPNTAEVVGETLIYAPMVPVAVATLPFLNLNVA